MFLWYYENARKQQQQGHWRLQMKMKIPHSVTGGQGNAIQQTITSVLTEFRSTILILFKKNQKKIYI